ncbi:MAG: hypothetical protein IJN58_08600 [Clostridia bacterium]|nr:hypothetical protein [Clostridia bacterium]
MKVISLKCPECNATLSIEGDRKYCFCQYCGTKILIDDGSTTHTYRKVDEARIREADIQEKIRLRELMLEEKKFAARERIKATKIKFSIILTVLGIGLIAVESIFPSGACGVAGLACLAILFLIWKTKEK